MRNHLVSAGTAFLIAIGLSACGATDTADTPGSLAEASVSSDPDDSSTDGLDSEPTASGAPERTPSDDGDTSLDSVPSWAGDYSMPPPMVVRGLDEARLEPWTWGWTSPPDADGETVSIVTDGAPPDPLETITHDGFVELTYPLSNWKFDARVVGADSAPPIEVISGSGETDRIDLTDVDDGSTIQIVGLASPGYYELIVSFAVIRAPTMPSGSAPSSISPFVEHDRWVATDLDGKSVSGGPSIVSSAADEFVPAGRLGMIIGCAIDFAGFGFVIDGSTVILDSFPTLDLDCQLETDPAHVDIIQAIVFGEPTIAVFEDELQLTNGTNVVTFQPAG